MYRDIDKKYDPVDVEVTAEDRARVVLWNIGTVLRDIAEDGAGGQGPWNTTVDDLTLLAERLGALLYTKTSSGTFGHSFPKGKEYDERWNFLLLGGRDHITQVGRTYPFEQ